MSRTTNSDSELATRLASAMDKVRRGEFSAVSELQAADLHLASELAPYLDDENEDVRREAASLLATSGGPIALSLLIRGLTDRAADVRERCAIALYEHYGPADYADTPELESALLKCLQMPDVSAAAVLLLSYSDGDDGAAALERLADTGDGKVQLFAYSAPAPLRLVALLSLARRGAPERQAALVSELERAGADELELLLDAIREVDSVALLGVAARLLDDTRPSATLAHSAPAIKPRLCDRAVNALVRRLELPVSFDLTEVRPYSAEELEEVRRLTRDALPQSPVA